MNLDKDRGINSLINPQRENVIETHHSFDKFNCESLELNICNSNRSMTKDIFHKEALQVIYNSRMYKVKLTCGVDLWVRSDEWDDTMVGVNSVELKCMEIKLWNVDPEVYHLF